MKNKIFNALVSLTLLAGLTACNEKWEPNGPQDSQMGTLSTANLTFDIANIDRVTRSRATTDYSDFIITVTDADDNIVEEWTYATMPSLPMFQVGDYKLNVESHIPESWAWDKPHFKGSANFTIEANKVTAIGNVTCKLQSLKVTVNFSEELTKASDGDLKCEVNVNKDCIATFEQGEQRAAYFVVPEGNTTMVATFSGTVNGYVEKIIRTYESIDQAVGKHFIINFSLKGGGPVVPPIEQGQWDPSQGISVDMTVESEDLSGNAAIGDEPVIDGERPDGEKWDDNNGDDPNGGEDPDPTPGPGDETEQAATFTSEMLDLNGANNIFKFQVSGTEDEFNAVSLSINCPKGVKNLKVNINSDNESFMSSAGSMLPLNFDLAEPESESLASDLVGLGFSVGDDVKGHDTVNFSIGGDLLFALSCFEGKHTFTIQVVDMSGNVSNLSLVFVAES